MTLRERIENDKLYQLLIKIKEKPETFLGDADLNILHGWICGYNLYKTLNSVKSDIDIFDCGFSHTFGHCFNIFTVVAYISTKV